MGQRNNGKAASKSGGNDNGINFRMPGKRAHSKTDHYENPSDGTPMNLGISGPISGMQAGVMGGAMGQMLHSPMDQQQYLPVGNSMKGMPNIPGRSMNQQRYSQMSDYVKNQNTQKEMQKRMAGGGPGASGPGTAAANGVSLRNNNFMRPSSANAKRKDGSAANGGGEANDLN